MKDCPLSAKICFFTGLFMITIGLLLSNKSFAKYNTSVESGVIVKTADLILETTNTDNIEKIAVGSDVLHYFSVKNYNEESTTGVAYDYYLFIVNEDDELVTDAKLYRPGDGSETGNAIATYNPNVYEEVAKVTLDEYGECYYGGEFFLEQRIDEYKLEVNNVSVNQLKIKIIGVQKNIVSETE